MSAQLCRHRYVGTAISAQPCRRRAGRPSPQGWPRPRGWRRARGGRGRRYGRMPAPAPGSGALTSSGPAAGHRGSRCGCHRPRSKCPAWRRPARRVPVSSNGPGHHVRTSVMSYHVIRSSMEVVAAAERAYRGAPACGGPGYRHLSLRVQHAGVPGRARPRGSRNDGRKGPQLSQLHHRPAARGERSAGPGTRPCSRARLSRRPLLRRRNRTRPGAGVVGPGDVHRRRFGKCRGSPPSGPVPAARPVGHDGPLTGATLPPKTSGENLISPLSSQTGDFAARLCRVERAWHHLGPPGRTSRPVADVIFNGGNLSFVGFPRIPPRLSGAPVQVRPSPPFQVRPSPPFQVRPSAPSNVVETFSRCSNRTSSRFGALLARVCTQFCVLAPRRPGFSPW
jgi:hypothetical protein